MCRIYAGTDPRDYEPETRSVRLHGLVTSIRLEARFWAILEEIARAEGLSLPRFIATLHDEVVELQGEVGNFASLLRVVCATYLERVAAPPVEGAPLPGDRRAA
jgi:predicted DNA-binding ribbon-helix-helix protein